jgi:hypothetical protein
MYQPVLGRFQSLDPINPNGDLMDDNNWFGDRLTQMRRQYGDGVVDISSPQGVSRALRLVAEDRSKSIQPPFTNGYEYAYNNPVNVIDPSGEQPPCTGRTRAVVAGGVLTGGWEQRTTTSVPYTPLWNGCSSPLLRGHFGLWDFTWCCDIHDTCYGFRCGQSKSACDSAFLTDMKAECATVFGAGLRSECYFMADMYFNAVRLLGGSIYEGEQDKACGWTPCCPPEIPYDLPPQL